MRTITPRRLLGVLLLTLPMLVAADTPKSAGPRSPKAKAAIRKYERSVEKAKAEYDRAVAAAAKELKAELDVALKAAMKAGSLEEAKRIESARPSAPAGQASAPGRGGGGGAAAAAGMAGRWRVTYVNGSERTYAVDGDGSVTWDGQRAQLTKTPSGIANDDNTLDRGARERYTLIEGDRLLVEHFRPAGTFPDGKPDQIGIGRRIADDPAPARRG